MKNQLLRSHYSYKSKVTYSVSTNFMIPETSDIQAF